MAFNRRSLQAPPLVVFALGAFIMVGCSKPSDDLFVWNRPISSLPIKLPITQSATCSFKKGLAVGFHKKLPLANDANGAEQVYYSTSDENEGDTVAFLDLDTNAPKVVSNGGQASLKVLYRDGQMLTLFHSSDPSTGTEEYTIFLDKGVVILSQQKDAPLIGPFGVIEMGYCN